LLNSARAHGILRFHREGLERFATVIEGNPNYDALLSDRLNEKERAGFDDAVAHSERLKNAVDLAETALDASKHKIFRPEFAGFACDGVTDNNLREFAFFECLCAPIGLTIGQQNYLRLERPRKELPGGVPQEIRAAMVRDIRDFYEARSTITAALVHQQIKYSTEFLDFLLSFAGEDAICPKALVQANDHSPARVALSMVMKGLGVPRIYLQHAEVTSQFPPLDFEYSVLRNEHALKIYQNIGPTPGKIFLIPRDRGPLPLEKLARAPESPARVVIYPTSRVTLDGMRAIVERLSQNPEVADIRLKPHPRAGRSVEEALAGSGVTFVQEFPADEHIAIAGNSSVAVDLLAMGIPVYQNFDFDPVGRDYYGYVGAGIVPEVTLDRLGERFWRPYSVDAAWRQGISEWLPQAQDADGDQAAFVEAMAALVLPGDPSSAVVTAHMAGMLADIATQLRADIDRLQADLAGKQEEIDRLQQESAQLRADMAARQQETELLRAEMAVRQQETELLRADMAARQQETKRLRAEMARKRRETDGLKARLAKTGQQKDRLAKKSNRKGRIVWLLAAPYLILTAPISVPLLFWKDRLRRKKKRTAEMQPVAAEDGSGTAAANQARNISRLDIPAEDGPGAAADAAPKVAAKDFSLIEELSSLPKRTPDELYAPSAIDDAPDDFVLCRIIGNDLVPRHAKGQSYSNLSFILEHEHDFENCRKLFVVNRIWDSGERAKILKLLEESGKDYVEVPFDPAQYRAIGWDFASLPRPDFFAGSEFMELKPLEKNRAVTAAYRLKNLYLMNNNGARNLALNEGMKRAKWVLPWDGNCFLTERGWAALHEKVVTNSRFRYFAVPMQRVTENAMLLADDFTPDPHEEPQLLFRRDAKERFNEVCPYGRRPKVELLWRLGIPGHWDQWRDDPWEQTRRAPGEEQGCVEVAGWVARLASGAHHLEKQKDVASFKNRGRVRNDAIMASIDLVDASANPLRGTGLYPKATLDRLRQALATGAGDWLAPARDLVRRADEALAQGSFSVVDKTTLPPSGDRQDYWHPAPYWWPDPEKPDGLPYVRIDGKRVPGTAMYTPESDKFDRTRLQLMFDNTAMLTLAAECTDRADYAEHAAELVRNWFVRSETRMNPHLEYAQVRRGQNGDRGFANGLIEFKDVYFFLPCVTALAEGGALSADNVTALRGWFETYQDWLETSAQGRKECTYKNNHGTYFDLQAAAIAVFLGDRERLRAIYLRAKSRLFEQIDETGFQPHEMGRTLTQHYVHFNLQGFLHLFRIAAAEGFPVPAASRMPGRRIEVALRWILDRDAANWPHEQIEPFDPERTTALVAAAQSLGFLADRPQDAARVLGTTCKFDPHDGIRPFWNIGDVAVGEVEDGSAVRTGT